MKKRFIGILMCAAMVLTLLPTAVLAAEPTDHWTDEANVGTLPVPVEDVYTITNAVELAAVAKAVNEQTNDFSGKTILLAGDIDLSAHLWVPIGSSYSSSFRGSFNGASHAITGLTIQTNTDAYVGLFGYACGGTYSNVTVKGSVSVEQNVKSSYVGGLIGCIYNSSSDSTKLSNVTTEHERSLTEMLNFATICQQASKRSPTALFCQAHFCNISQNLYGVSCPFPGDGAPFLHFAGKGRPSVRCL